MTELPDWLTPLTKDDLVKIAAIPGGLNDQLRAALDLHAEDDRKGRTE